MFLYAMERGAAVVTEYAHFVISTPVGPLVIRGTTGAVHEIHFVRDKSMRDELMRDDPADSHEQSVSAPVRDAVRQLDEYFHGRRHRFDVPIDLAGTSFQRAVWNQLLTIPYGTTCTYGDLADAVGKPGAARAVGAAVGRNPISVVVPCHRVVAAGGRLGGYGGGLDKKRFLLQLEGNRF